MLCSKDVFIEPCKDCKSKFIVMVDELKTGEELYFCYETKEQAVQHKNQCETHNEIEGIPTVPRTSILLVPRDDD